MQRREARGEVRVAAIHGQRVLHEIVGADAEEGDVVDERVGRDSAAAGVSIITPSGTSCRYGDAARIELRAPPRSGALAPPHLVERDDERQHDAHVAVHRGAQQRAQLRLEQLGLVEAHPDRAPAEERIRLGRKSADRQLVAADVERANDDRPPAERLDDAR